MPLSPSAIGVLACAIMIIFWITKGRKDFQSFLTVVFGCAAILLLVKNWDSVVFYSEVLFPHSSGAVPMAVVQVVPTQIPTHIPTHVVHITPTAVHAVNKGSQHPQLVYAPAPAIPSSPVQFLEGFIPVLLLVFIVLIAGWLVVVANKKLVGYSARSGGNCPVCGQKGPIQEVSWREGKVLHTRTMCHDCAARRRETAAAS